MGKITIYILKNLLLKCCNNGTCLFSIESTPCIEWPVQCKFSSTVEEKYMVHISAADALHNPVNVSSTVAASLKPSVTEQQ